MLLAATASSPPALLLRPATLTPVGTERGDGGDTPATVDHFDSGQSGQMTVSWGETVLRGADKWVERWLPPPPREARGTL